MGRIARIGVAWVVVWIAPFSASAGGQFSGKWELQTMGSDRDMTVEHEGSTLVLHRVMWPEFEGERYKLEHLYRGQISGSKVTGELLVREEEIPEYEVLRSFEGKVDGSALVIDGLSLLRKGGQAPPATPPPPAVAAAPATPPPPAASPSAPAAPQAPPAPAAPSQQTVAADGGGSDAPSPDPGLSLFQSILGSPGGSNLLKVSATVTMPDLTKDLLAQGDALYDAGRFKKALATYAEAASRGTKLSPGLLHRQGRCLLALNKRAKAKKMLRRALRLDPENKELKADYAKAKRKR